VAIGLGKQAIGFKPIDIAQSEAVASDKAKYFLKRLARDNAKVRNGGLYLAYDFLASALICILHVCRQLIGRQLGQHTHNAPLIVFSHMLAQIENFDNLIPYVVEALKYTSELARDCLSFCLLKQLQKDGDKMKRGDTHYSSWFAALSKFIGKDKRVAFGTGPDSPFAT
jgi:Transcription- and export-related complex subunit